MTTSKELPGSVWLRFGSYWCEGGFEPNKGNDNEYIRADLVQKLVEALEKISTTKFLSYENSPAPPYGTGVTDGHRLAAEWAREALAWFRGEVK